MRQGLLRHSAAANAPLKGRRAEWTKWLRRCDKLDLCATDEKGISQDLQVNIVLRYAAGPQAIPCYGFVLYP